MYGSSESERTAFRTTEKKYKLYYDSNKKKKKLPRSVDLSDVIDFKAISESFYRNEELPVGVSKAQCPFDKPVFCLDTCPGSLLVSMEENCLTKKRKVSVEENSVTRRIKAVAEKKCVTKRVSMEENSSLTKKRKVSMEENLVTRKQKVAAEKKCVIERVSMEENSSLTKKRKVSTEENSVTKRTKVLAERKCITKRVSMEENSSVTKKRKFLMEEIIPEEIIEQVLVRLDVKDLIRCKSVCKSWKSLISQHSFIKTHLNYCNNNNDNPHTRIDQVILPTHCPKPGQEYYIVGFSNGLVCINSFHGNEFIVANPWTREERMVQKHLASDESCWGFGYDSVTNDYKIVFGVKEGKYQTSFHVLSLKSNVWKHVGHVNYTCFHFNELATLCNGALHWLMHHEGQENSFIISFDISKEVFKEIPQPDDARYNPNKEDIPSMYMTVGIKDECLCIWRNDLDDHPNMWIMQKYNVKESWVTLGSNCQRKVEFFPSMDKDEVENEISDIRRSIHDTWFLKKCMCVPTTTIMESLISPHQSEQ